MNDLASASWNSLPNNLKSEADSVTFSWDELEKIVGKLPNSASVHRAWWSGDRPHVQIWKSEGFEISNVRLGSQVTFVRRGPRSLIAASVQRRYQPLQTPDVAAKATKELPNPHLVLISCVSKKRSEPALAKNLYVSDLFEKERSYAERSGAPWYILSGEHGLVSPDTWLAPYDCYLPKKSAEYQRAWGTRVVAALEAAEGPLTGKVIEIHAAIPYIAAIRSGLQSRGAIVTERWRGLSGIGKILKWYAEYLSELRVEGASGGELPEINSLVAQLMDESSALSPQEFIASGSSLRRVPGLYSWWVDEQGASDLTTGLGYPIKPGMIYAGLAGATRWPSGKPSTNTLWMRIATMHLGTNHQLSTLRHTLGAILTHAEVWGEFEEAALTSWMHTHLRVIAVPFLDADLLGRVEEALLVELDPPLNLRGMAKTPLRLQLTALRRTAIQKSLSK